jgi:hypothetical protein
MKISKSRLKQIIKEEYDAVKKVRVPIKQSRSTLSEMSGSQMEDLLHRQFDLIKDIGAIIEDQATGGYKPEEALSMIQSAIREESISRSVPFAQDDEGPDIYGPFGKALGEKKDGE